MANKKLRSALVEHFRKGNVTNVSQTTAQLIQEPAWRRLGSEELRRAIFKLEKDGVLKRETEGGVTRFRYTGKEKYAIPLCPKCGGMPAGTVENVPGVAGFHFDADGKAHYTGETELNWDGQETARDADGETLLECADCCEQYPAPDDFEIG